jgi:ATP-dependent RNA/DNA helicase IGHMBP2
MLKANALVADRLLHVDDKPFTFINTAGAGYDEEAEGTSTFNPGEAAFITRHNAHMSYENVAA